MNRPGPPWPAPELPEPAAPSPEYRQAQGVHRLQQLRKALREIEAAAARQALALAAQRLESSRERLFEVGEQVRRDRESAQQHLGHAQRDTREIRRWRSRDAALLLSLSEPRMNAARAEEELAVAQQKLAARVAALRSVSLRYEKYSTLLDEMASQ